MEELLRLRAKYEFLLLAFVFMPDHAHFVVAPAKGFSIGRTMRIVKGTIARRINVVGGIRGSVWQTGFFGKVPSTLDDLNSFIRYTHENPVRAGLVESVSDYPYSSADGRCSADYDAFLQFEHD
jgi:REP element-mobilizing transposase RayT